MKKVILVISVVCLMASSAWGIIDPTPDLLGLYFDDVANLYCIEEVAPFTTWQMYAVYSNPSVPEIVGFEFGIDWPADVIIMETIAPGNLFWDPIENEPYVVGLGSPQPMGTVNVLVRFSILYIEPDSSPVGFYLHGAESSVVPGDLPVVWLPDSNHVQIQVLNGLGNATTTINAGCTVATNPTTWDTLKAIYR